MLTVALLLFINNKSIATLLAQCDEEIVQLGGNYTVTAVVHCRKSPFTTSWALLRVIKSPV